MTHHKTAALSVEGQLTEGTMSELIAATDEPSASAFGLGLDLSAITYADQSGAGLLRSLVAGGARVESCSGFVEQLLEGSKTLSPEPPSSVAGSDLVSWLRAGDERAFEEIVSRFGGRLLSVARRFLNSDEDARDAVQEAFLSAFQSIAQFNGDALLSTWLHRIVVNAALMQLRRRRRKPEQSIDELLPRFDADGAWAEDCVAASVPTEELLEQQETREMILRCVGKLPASYRAVLLLRDFEDLDTAETASRLGIGHNAVKVRLHRARQALRTLIERESGARPAASSPSSTASRRKVAA